MSRLRNHLLLVIVFGSAVVLGAIERSDPDIMASDTDPPRFYLDPEWNIADLSSELYPERAQTLYYRAFQASLCQDVASPRDDVCARRGPPKPGEVRELFERSLATGNRSNELALYNYVLVLLHEGAPPDEVDAAVRRWRATYPRSQRPDPRELARAMPRTAVGGAR